MKLFKATVKDSNRTGFGVDDVDRSNGIYTVAAKLAHMCPLFDELSLLFGERQNLNPSHVFDSSEIQCETSSDNNLGGNELGDTTGEYYQDASLFETLPSQSSSFPFNYLEPTLFENAESAVTQSPLQSTPFPRTPFQSTIPSLQPSKKRDFNTAYLDCKSSEMEFKRVCFEKELELKREELDMRREELKINDKLVRKDIVNSLIQNGKTAEEIKAFLHALEL